MSTIRLTTEPVSRRQVAQLAETLGLRPVGDAPWVNGIRHATWEDDERRLVFGMHACSGAGLLLVSDPQGGLVEQIEQSLPTETAEQAIERCRAATEPAPRIRAMYRLSTLLLVTTLEPEEAVLDAIGERLCDEVDLVRWAAARILRFRSDRYTETLLARAKERFADLAPVHASVLEACVGAEEGTLWDEPTDSWWELLQRAREGIAADQWTRVERSMDALLDDRADHAEGLFLRALAHERSGDSLLALALLGASQATLSLTLDSSDEDEDEDEDEETIKNRALLEEVIEARPRMEQAVDAASEDTVTEAQCEALLAWLRRWDGDTAARAGAARALVDRVPALAGLLALEAGSYDDDLPLLRRAVDLVPDAPRCRIALASALRRDDQLDAARDVYRDALARLRVPAEDRSADARQLEALASEELEPSSVLLPLTELAYEQERWDDAARLGDELVQADPNSMMGWQIRANARTFGGRLEDAAVAYAEALEALDHFADDPDSLYFGDDARPLMRFNRASVLAKLGRDDESLEQLRHAVRADETWGPKAVEDDFFEALWTNERFVAIVAAEPTALILDEEKQPGFLEALVRRCIGLSHVGRADEAVEQCERAVELAVMQGRLDLQAKAHGVWGRTLAFEGEVEEGLEHLERALEHLDDIPEDARAELLHTHGVVLHQAERFDEAEQAYRQAQDLRAQLDGRDHPVLAKGYGDLARLAADRGDGPERAAELTAKGLAVLERYLARDDVERDDTWREAEMDACILQVNIGHSRAQDEDLAGAIEAVDNAADRIRSAIGHGTMLGRPFLDNATGLARALTAAEDPELRAKAHAVLLRLETAELDGPPEEIEEHLFWRRIRSLARRLHAHGVDDAAFAGVMQRAIRGELSAPELSSVPELAGLPAALSVRAERYPTLLAMLAMGLSTVEAEGATLDETLENLEELCVSSLYTSGVLTDDAGDEAAL